MSLCASCGTELTGNLELCPHHHFAHVDDGWAIGNRHACDLIHRGIVPPRAERADADEGIEVYDVAM